MVIIRPQHISELILTDICWWSYNDRYMKTYMNEICSHISVDIKVYWPIYVNCHKYRSIYAQNWILKIFIYRSKNAKFQHISVKIWILENFHISVDIELAYIGHYTDFNIDRYMVTYFEGYTREKNLRHATELYTLFNDILTSVWFF